MNEFHEAMSTAEDADNSERGVALLSALIFMVVMAGLSVVLLSVVLAQSIPTYLAQKSTQTINVAQSGMQATLGVIRSVATAPDASGNVYGNPSKLPCSVTGTVNAQSDGYTYTVAVSYFLDDPKGQSSSWQSANMLACSASTGVSQAPAYALLVSTGVGPAIPGSGSSTGNRIIQAIYKFQVSTVNIPGGRIYDFNNAYCLDATTATVGSTVRFLAKASCTNDDNELWVYDTDYKIKLASSLAGGAVGLCITGPSASGGATQNITLQKCRTNSTRWNQLWSWIGSNSWLGQNQTIANGPSGYCLSTGYSDGANLTGKFLQVSSTGCNGGFAPTLEVGAGAAGYATHQLVNYAEFGRCADITNENLSSSFMISYPCKQDATGTGTYLLWNHKWYYSEPSTGQTSLSNQKIYVNYLDNASSKYCLQAPATGVSPAYVTFTTCTTSALQKWTRVGNSGTYDTSYLMVASDGRCLAVDPSDVYAGNWSKLILKPCDGSLEQKWNAPAGNTESTIGGYREIAP